jgi:hypothetical protein
MQTIIRASQEEMKAAIQSIWSQLEETINSQVEASTNQ